MKTIVCRSMAAALLCVFALGVSAQDVLKVKVMNIPSAVGKIMIATDKGQYGMVDAKGTEAVNEKESLELITRMIQNTKDRMAENSGTPFLLWGYVTVIISLLVWFLLKETGNNNWQFLWFLLPVIAFPATLWSQRKARKMLKTYIDRVVDYVWTVFGLGAFLVSCTAIFVWKIPILFVILLMMGMGTALTGLIVNTKVVTIGGVLGALLSLGCFYMPGIDQILFFALAFVFMMVIPGHYMNSVAKRHKQ